MFFFGLTLGSASLEKSAEIPYMLPLKPPLRFVWDQTKAESNFIKHGLKFESALDVFLDPFSADFDTSRKIDGEARRKAVGLMSGRLVTVVYSLRGDALRIISARPANAKEKRRHADG